MIRKTEQKLTYLVALALPSEYRKTADGLYAIVDMLERSN